MNNRVKAYKAFNQDMTCRGFQYEVGKTYKHEGDASLCNTGFHACLHPLAVLNYYPVTSRFAVVELNGVSPETDEYTKVCGAEITIQAEVQISDLVDAAVKHVFDAAQWIKGSAATGDRGAASATGYRGAASATGDNGAASATGDGGAASATGDRSVASATGKSGAASATGKSGAASATAYSGAASATGISGAASATGISGAAFATGHSGAASATGYRSAASATGRSGAASATGNGGVASATGNGGAASATGPSGAASATGDSGAAMASGYRGRAMGAEGCAIFLCERDDATGEFLHVWAGIAGQDGIKPMTWYFLKNGHPMEVEE